MRIFLGIDLPSDIKTNIHNHLLPIQKSIKGWENPHDYHQTLLFIGESSEDKLRLIEEKLEQFSFDPFKISTDDFHFFNRRIMYLGFEESHELIKLKEKVDQAFYEWVKPEAKPFIPHVTVKRWQRYEYDHLIEGLAVKKLEPMEFEVKGISIFKSEKDVLNRKYHVIKTKFF